MQAIRLKKIIQKNGELHLTNLSVSKGQEVELVLLLEPHKDTAIKERLTARQLLNSSLIGLWKDRTDIGDSTQYARQLRDQGQRRRR